jgi:hypothetical protein
MCRIQNNRRRLEIAWRTASTRDADRRKGAPPAIPIGFRLPCRVNAPERHGRQPRVV